VKKKGSFLKVQEMNTNMNIEQMNEIFKNGSEKERQKIIEMFANMNVNNRNNDKTEKYAKKILKKKNEKINSYVNFLESKSVNGLIWAPTQVGKTAATRVFIETCFEYNTPVIVSTDNKTDQQEQLYNRIEAELMGAEVELLKVTDKNFEKDLRKCIEERKKRFVIFCLDNSSQIEKVIIQLTSNYVRYEQMAEIKRIAILHDEGDSLAKDQDTENIKNGQAQSHKKWLELKDVINKRMGNLDLKRIFVTATPENVVMLYQVECPDVMRLEIPATYTGYDKIQYVKMEDDLRIGQYLSNEVERIKEAGTYEAILYCIDRKIVDGHEALLKNLSKQLECVVNTYNGDGISTYIKTNLRVKFEKKLIKHEIQFEKKGRYYKMKNMAIRKFYTIIKSIGENCIVTIGKDLICRGISYVGENVDEPITATTMFYKPGKTMNAVGICQTIGRITGCAMPSLNRKLYCPEDVYTTYMTYNKNQELFIKKIEQNENQTSTKVIVDSTIFEEYKRPIDRPKLNLKMKMVKKRVESESEESESEDEETEIDGVNLKKLRNWIDGETLVGKMINYLYEYGSMSSEELKEGLNYEKSDQEFRNNIDGGRGLKCQYGKLWIARNNQIHLNKNIIKYIDKID
jgi:DNA-binding MarR family transcriptional regulator